MVIPILMPKIGFSMDEGILADWLVADGGDVKVGEPLYTLESEKSAEDIPAPASGKLKIIAKRG